MTRLSYLLLFIMSFSLGHGSCTPIKQTKRSNVISGENYTTANLEVAMQETTLSVKLSNVGKRQICVDRELIFLSTITPVSVEGDAIALQEVAVAPAMAPSSTISRFVLLQPGESVERRVILNEPFKQFTSGISSPSMTVTAYEGFYILPQDKMIAEIRITYGYQYGTREGLEFYLGKEQLPTDIYEGPLKASLSVKK